VGFTKTGLEIGINGLYGCRAAVQYSLQVAFSISRRATAKDSNGLVSARFEVPLNFVVDGKVIKAHTLYTETIVKFTNEIPFIDSERGKSLDKEYGAA
jgi:hypothetical protein